MNDSGHDSLSQDQIDLLKRRISGWLRQSRYRARKSNVDVDVNYNDVIEIYEDADYKCAYCDSPAGSPDHPFPIKDRGPCVPANIVPCCDGCRTKKKNRGLIKFYQDKFIPQERLNTIVKSMLSRKGSPEVKSYLKGRFQTDQESETT